MKTNVENLTGIVGGAIVRFCSVNRAFMGMQLHFADACINAF